MGDLFENCPTCGGELEQKTVEKVLRGGKNTAVLNVSAQVCHRCGERLYDQETIERFEKIRSKLKEKKTSSFEEMGTTYRID